MVTKINGIFENSLLSSRVKSDDTTRSERILGYLLAPSGALPSAYVFMALFADVLDHLEWKNGFRCDGMAMSVYSIITTISAGIATGLFNFGLSSSGYIAPSYDAVTGLTTSVIQNSQTQSVITFFFVGLETITGIICAVLLCNLNVEKEIHKEMELK